MKLIIDIGNTLQKAAIFDRESLIAVSSFNIITISDLEKIFSDNQIEATILSSVANYDEDIKTFLKCNSKFLELDHNTPVPIINKYGTPQKLGKDRLASATASQIFFKGKNVLVIDIGTAIKYDFVNKIGEYLGGSISPGINLRFRALHNYTAKLPLVTYQKSVVLTGQNTKDSLLSGVINGAAFEIDGFIDNYRSKYEGLEIILSGGDHNYFEKRLKNTIFVVPNIVLLGLNKILDYNATT
jgi:type III pantothenate kinase